MFFLLSYPSAVMRKLSKHVFELECGEGVEPASQSAANDTDLHFIKQSGDRLHHHHPVE